MKARRIIASIAIPALAAGMVASVAFAQVASPENTVDVKPVGTSRLDPNGGRWFVADLSPNESKTFQVELFNPTRVAHTVTLFLSDMSFDKNGNPFVTNVATDVGKWGHFEHSTATIAPLKRETETFTLTAPKGADPGDHIGAVVAEQAATGAGSVKNVERVAVRLYVTLPGDARKDFEIEKVTAARHSVFFPRQLEITAQLRNTGRVRLEPKVTINKAAATGSVMLMSQSAEQYKLTRPIPFWGGPVMLHVSATTNSLGLPGPARQANVLVWVIPWHLFALLLLLAAIAFAIRRYWRRRMARVEALKSDLRRIERLITSSAQSGTAPDGVSPPIDPNAAIRAAIKQARRAGDDETAARLSAMQTTEEEKKQGAPDDHAARIAIFAAAKEARKRGDVEAAQRLEQYLAETARHISAGEPSPSSQVRRTG